MVLLPSFRDLADNTPAPTDRSTPSYCANLQAPRDTWVQLCTASLVEPTHHVSVWPPAAFSHVLEVPSHHNFPLVNPFLPLSPPPLHSSFCSSVSLWLEQTALPIISFCRFPQRPEAVVNQSPMCASALLSHQIWSPPSYATAQILHGLPRVTMGTRHLSARTKLKCNSHFTIIVIVIMRHSLTFLQKLLLIWISFLCSFANQSLLFVVILFYSQIFFFSLCLSLELQKDSWPIMGVGRSCFCVVLVCVVLPAAAQLAGKYWALISHHHLYESLQRNTHWHIDLLCCQIFKRLDISTGFLTWLGFLFCLYHAHLNYLFL